LEGADVPDEVFLKIINWLRQTYTARGKSCLFHIYTQETKTSNLARYKAADVVLHADESIEDTFTGLVLANALVISPSSFSYAAAILSEGDVYYQRFWHPPLPGWKVV